MAGKKYSILIIAVVVIIIGLLVALYASKDSIRDKFLNKGSMFLEQKDYDKAIQYLIRQLHGIKNLQRHIWVKLKHSIIKMIIKPLWKI